MMNKSVRLEQENAALCAGLETKLAAENPGYVLVQLKAHLNVFQLKI